MINSQWSTHLSLSEQDIKAIPALIIVDVQNDFISGSLALKTCPAGQDGAEVVPMINDLLSKRLFPHVAYTKDWHPADHISFIDNVMNFPVHPSSRLAAQHAKVFDTVTFDIGRKVEQKLWPRHCQVDTPGAELHKDLTVCHYWSYYHKLSYVVQWLIVRWHQEYSICSSSSSTFFAFDTIILLWYKAQHCGQYSRIMQPTKVTLATKTSVVVT